MAHFSALTDIDFYLRLNHTIRHEDDQIYLKKRETMPFFFFFGVVGGLMFMLQCGRIFLRASWSPERVKPCMSALSSSSAMIRVWFYSYAPKSIYRGAFAKLINYLHNSGIYRAVELVAVSVRVKFAGRHINTKVGVRKMDERIVKEEFTKFTQEFYFLKSDKPVLSIFQETSLVVVKERSENFPLTQGQHCRLRNFSLWVWPKMIDYTSTYADILRRR